MKEVLSVIKPSSSEEREIKKISEEIKHKIKIKDAKPMLGGSAAKGTWLKGSHDIDIYVQFDKKKYAGKGISKILKKNIEKKFGLSLVHGSRDYFQFEHNDFTVEIVPIIKITKSNEALNITDISPLHVKWVKKHKGKADEVRLTKAFCKANKIYGAESYIKGFSGYVLEILTIHYGGFQKLLKKASRWKDKTIIDTENFFKGEDILKELNKAKLQSPLILIDPVQKERNAAAGVSKKTYEKFIRLARAFLKKPSVEFFKKKELTIEILRGRAEGKKLILLEAEALKGKRDVVGSKMLKVYEHLKKGLRKNGFGVVWGGWEWNGKALLWFIVDKKLLSKKTRHYGPPKGTGPRLENFKGRWVGHRVYYEKGISYVNIEREFRDAKEFIKDRIKKDYIKERVKKIKVLL